MQLKRLKFNQKLGSYRDNDVNADLQRFSALYLSEALSI